MALDSNVVLDAFENADRDALALIEMHPDRVTLQVATRTPYLEATRWSDTLAERGIEVVSSVTRLGSWVLGQDVLGGGEISEVVDRATEIIFPQGVGAGERAQNRLRDADIVEAHRRSGADVLVTRDGAVLRAAPVLLDELGVRIVSPPDACRLILGVQ